MVLKFYGLITAFKVLAGAKFHKNLNTNKSDILFLERDPIQKSIVTLLFLRNDKNTATGLEGYLIKKRYKEALFMWLSF